MNTPDPTITAEAKLAEALKAMLKPWPSDTGPSPDPVIGSITYMQAKLVQETLNELASYRGWEKRFPALSRRALASGAGGELIAWAIKDGRSDEFITRFEDDMKIFAGKDGCTIQPLYAHQPPEPKPAPDHAALVAETYDLVQQVDAEYDPLFKKLRSIVIRLADALASAPSGEVGELWAWLTASQSLCGKLAAENARLREIEVLARGVEFTAYPAHGSGFIIQATGTVLELRAALAPADGEG